MTLDEFRESLDQTSIEMIAGNGCGLLLQMHSSIRDGESKNLGFTVINNDVLIYAGQSFSTATRRYWEIAFGGEK